MKTCKKCNETKPLTEFYKHKEGKMGVRPECKKCTLEHQSVYRGENKEARDLQKATYRANNKEKIAEANKRYREANKARIAEASKRYYEANKERISASIAKWKSENKDKVLETKRRWRERNKDKVREEYERNKHQYFNRASQRRTKVKEVTPAWSNKEVVEEYYKAARAFNKYFPEMEFHVDHIVPLKSELVCGLHSDTNLRITTASENFTKGNRYWPDMPSDLIL